jgi:hypothetical protein
LVELEATAGETVVGVPLQKEGGKIYFTAPLEPCGVTLLPMASGAAPAAVAENSPLFETEHYAVDFTTPYPKITAKKFGVNVFPDDGFGEIIFRHDAGTMWYDRALGAIFGREHLREKVVSVKSGPVFYQVITAGELAPDPVSPVNPRVLYHAGWLGLGPLTYQKEWRFYRALDYFTLKLTLDWQGADTKIQIRFPLQIDPVAAAALYAVPFGSIARKPYYDVPPADAPTLKALNPGDYRTAGGDWPALHWVDYGDDRAAMALANVGTPAHQLVGGAILVGLIRSGTMTADGSLKPEIGALDHGVHEYEFAFRAHDPADTGAAPALGRVLNRKPLAFRGQGQTQAPVRSAVALDGDNVEISSIRPTAGGFIVRLFETLGRPARATLASTLEPFTLWSSDLLEREWTPIDGRVVDFAPLQIRTIKVQVN